MFDKATFVDVKGAIGAPYIKYVNMFLSDFIKSPEQRVEFTAEDLKLNGEHRPLLRELQGLEYERIRLRLRAMCSRDPVRNLKTEIGKILCVFSGQGVIFRTTFAAKAESISIEKMEVTRGT